MVTQSANDSTDDGRLDEAFAAYLRLCDSGEQHDRESFLAQFPELADPLRQLLDAADLLSRELSLEALDETLQLPVAAKDDPTIVNQDSATSPNLATHGVDQETLLFKADASLPGMHRGGHVGGPRLPYQIGDYLLEEILGKGGMGIVYRAIQQPLQRAVAVKMIRSGVFADEGEVKRFFAEARAAARLHHPNIVGVYHFGQLDGHYFFSMEYVSGTDLAKQIRQAPLAPETASRYVRDVARAIDYAHRRGVLHRDLKPANVLVDDNDRVLVTDFGLARQTDTESSLTASGIAVGTPSYMPPEQAKGQGDRMGVTADVYSLGAILFAALSGQPPFQGNSVMETIMQVLHDDPPSLSTLRPDVPADLETICEKCLAKEPTQRYSSAAALANDLDRFLHDEPITAKPMPPLVRGWRWLQGVPLVAALTGQRRLVQPTLAHRRFQNSLLLLLLLIPVLIAGFLVTQRLQAQRLPKRIKIAGGIEGGVYSDLAARLAERMGAMTDLPTEVIPSGGSLDNHQALLTGAVHLAPLQASAISGEDIGVIAPLFYEMVHVLVRDRAAFSSISQFGTGEAVIATGAHGSGSRKVTTYLFDSYQIDPHTVALRELEWTQLHDSPDVDAAVICVGTGSQLINQLLASGWQLLPIEDPIAVSLQHPTLQPMTILPRHFPDCELPAAGIPTVGTTGYLAAATHCPDALVWLALEALYAQPPPITGMISRRQASEWQGLALHPAARRFFAAATQPNAAE